MRKSLLALQAVLLAGCAARVTQLVIDLVDLLRGATDPALRPRIRKFLWPILAFAAGAISGAFAYVQFGFWALAVPLVLLCALVAAPE